LALATSVAAASAGLIARLMLAEQATVAVTAAISLTVLIYGAAIALDLANLYFNKSIDQRAADQSAIAAAFTYASTGSTATAQSAAASLALANGIASATDVTTTIGPSPSGDGHQAAKVVIVTPIPLTGAGRMITSSKTLPGGDTNLSVGATAYAEIHEGTPCVLALASPGIAMTGGSNLAATSCSVDSDNVINVSNGPTLTATTIQAVGAITNSNGTINGAKYPNSSTTSDPYASSNVFARIPTVLSEAQYPPSFPSLGTAPPGGANETCSGGALTLAGSTNYGTVTVGSNCTTLTFSGGGTTTMLGLGASQAGATVVFGAGTYKIGSNGIAISAYGALTFTLNGSPTIDDFGPMQISASAPVNFNGTANWYVGGGINDSASAPVSFTNTGSSPSSFTVADISVSNAAASFPNGTYTITGSGLTVNGNSATFGSGSFIIVGGISVGGGKILTIGNALTSGSVFEVLTSATGTSCPGTAVATGGGTTLTIGSFSNVDICGQVVTDGSSYLGAGNYTIDGALNLSSAGGGTFSGSSVSIVASGPIQFGQGFSTITLDAPTGITSSTEGGTQTVALASSTTSTSTISQGATNSSVVGLVYLPNSPLTISGAGNLTGGGNCLQVIANSISMSGSGSLTTNCSSLGAAAAAGAVTLVE
jgi:hypothetical protein